jgi:hypothetical protein
VRNGVHIRALQRAAELFGGAEGLAKRLNISRVRIDVWLRGDAPIPGDVFLAVVDILLAHGLATLKKSDAGHPQICANEEKLESKGATR